MPKPSIIGITGPARSGKDTVAGFIISATGGYQYAFADPMRAMLATIGVNLTDPYWQARKETKIPLLDTTPRRLMQTLGTEWGRNLIHPDIWVLLAQQRFLTDGPGMVVSDVRFENEAKWVRDQGGHIIHVYREAAEAVEAHVSEHGVVLMPEDTQLFNVGTLADLQYSILALLDGF